MKHFVLPIITLFLMTACNQTVVNPPMNPVDPTPIGTTSPSVAPTSIPQATVFPTPSASPVATISPSPSPNATSAPSPQATAVPTPKSTPLASTSPSSSPGPVTSSPSPVSSGDFIDPSCSGIDLYSFPQDANGWTILPALNQPGRHVIYVSSKNTVHNDGVNFYVQTAEQGVLLLRKGLPDSLLFNRGETFHLAASISNVGLMGGDTPDLSKVIGAYGTGERPVIMWNQAHSVIAIEGYSAKNLIITQLDLQPDLTIPKHGVGITLAPGGNAKDNVNFLIEDVRVGGAQVGYGFSNNLDIENMTNFTLRRSEILDACSNFRSQGAFIENVIGEKIEENFMDSNGLGICGVLTSGSGQAQNIYSTVRTKCVRAFGNSISNAHGNGFEMRYGGIFENNLMYKNNTDLNWGVTKGGSVEGKELPLGVSGHITGNVFTSTINFGNSNAVLVQNNIFDTPITGGQLVVDTTSGVGVHHAKIDSNIFYGGKYPLSVEGGAAFGPLTAYNDGTKNKIVLYSQPWTADWKNPQGVLVFQYLDMFSKTNSDGSVTKYPEGYEVNGCDLFNAAGVKILSSASNGILCPPPNPHLSFPGNESFTNNIIQNVWHPIEFGQVSTNVTSLPVAQAFFKDFVMSGNTWNCGIADPTCKAAPTTWDPSGKVAVVTFVNPTVNVPANYVTLVRAQSHDHWNADLLAANVNKTIQAGFKVK